MRVVSDTECYCYMLLHWVPKDKYPQQCPCMLLFYSNPPPISTSLSDFLSDSIFILSWVETTVLQIDANSREGCVTAMPVSLSLAKCHSFTPRQSFKEKQQRVQGKSYEAHLIIQFIHCRMLLDRSKPAQHCLNGLALSICCILLYVFCQRNSERKPTPRNTNMFFLADGTLSMPINFDPSAGSTSSS